LAKLIPWLFLIPPSLVALAALATWLYQRSAPGRARALLRQGGIHTYRQEPAQAEEAFRAGLALRPGHPGLLGSLASLLVSQGRHQEARHVLEQAQRADPGDLRLKLMQGRCLAGLEQHQEALQVWSSIPEDSDVYVDAQGEVAQALERQGDRAGAMEALERAIARGQVHQVRPFKKELRRLKKEAA
jgi:predicted Zn-dependent protease